MYCSIFETILFLLHYNKMERMRYQIEKEFISNLFWNEKYRGEFEIISTPKIRYDQLKTSLKVISLFYLEIRLKANLFLKHG